MSIACTGEACCFCTQPATSTLSICKTAVQGIHGVGPPLHDHDRLLQAGEGIHPPVYTLPTPEDTSFMLPAESTTISRGRSMSSISGGSIATWQ